MSDQLSQDELIIKAEVDRRLRAPQQATKGYVDKSILVAVEGIMKAVASHLRPAIDEIEKLQRTAGQMKYLGVYRQGTAYSQGNFVTYAGSLWHCNADSTEAAPGDGVAWTLAVKRTMK